MCWSELRDCADVAGNLATVATALIAGGALWFAWRQISENRKISRESGALGAYRDYLRLCFDFPQYSSAKMALREIGAEDFSGIECDLTKRSEKYLWFLSILLNTAEQILLDVEAEGEWRIVLKWQLHYHHPALQEIWPGSQFGYSGAMRKLVDEVLAEGPDV
ncbi:hypothetical protein [Rhizobium sp. BK251]|uniref:hypothetical protein n=1 Tax=Rhizobium sp. BK251 TaxID=2512125 RepID=UPI00104A0A67|nr:hypothetical protein [Rhizobium sp. BK251]